MATYNSYVCLFCNAAALLERVEVLEQIVMTYERPLRAEITAELVDYFLEAQTSQLQYDAFDGWTNKTGDFCAAFGRDFDVYHERLESLKDKELMDTFNKKRWPKTKEELDRYLQEGDIVDENKANITVSLVDREKADRLVGAFCNLFDENRH